MMDWRDDYLEKHDWSEPNAVGPTLHEEDREARVTYRSSGGDRFRVIVRQKPNPIGFTARMPGSRRGR